MIELTFDLPITLRRAHPRVKGHAGKVALTRRPLVYCLESVDNPGVNSFTARLNSATIHAEYDERLSGIIVLRAETLEQHALTFIPYQLWANRGESQMTVWVKAE